MQILEHIFGIVDHRNDYEVVILRVQRLGLRYRYVPAAPERPRDELNFGPLELPPAARALQDLSTDDNLREKAYSSQPFYAQP